MTPSIGPVLRATDEYTSQFWTLYEFEGIRYRRTIDFGIVVDRAGNRYNWSIEDSFPFLVLRTSDEAQARDWLFGKI